MEFVDVAMVVEEGDEEERTRRRKVKKMKRAIRKLDEEFNNGFGFGFG